MPYCEPAHVWHPDEDVQSAYLIRCECGQYHHIGEQCPNPGDIVTYEAWRERTSAICAECGISHHGEPCPYIAIECDECGQVHAPCDECPEWCEDCAEYFVDGHECPYVYCEECGEAVYDPYGEHAEVHRDDCGGGCCESPQLAFTIRNDGSDAPLPNDTRITVTLPAGVISDAGIKEIARYLHRAGHSDVAYSLEHVGREWQTRQGNYPKRLSRFAYQQYGAKLMPETMSAVGTIARDHSNAVSVTVEISRDLNQSAAYWYHEDSCYWGGYYESRCALKTNGAFGIRSFDQYGIVSGRVWVMPLKQDAAGRMSPTFDTMSPDAFIVFNGYGDMGGYAGARLMAHMAGWTYRKIRFDCDPMYINAGGYLVAPEHIAEPYTDGSLRLSVPQHSSLYESETRNV